MSNDVTFQLDPLGGEEILQRMAAPTIKRSADAIASRARSMAQSMTSEPPEITVTSEVNIIRRGYRAISKVRANGKDAHSRYVGRVAILKSRDAGRV